MAKLAGRASQINWIRTHFASRTLYIFHCIRSQSAMQNHPRRDFLCQAGLAAGAAMLGVSLPQFLAAAELAEKSRTEGGPFKTLAPKEAIEIEAMAACILPTTDTPGAREAGAIYFIDNVLGGLQARLLPMIRTGLDDLQQRAQSAQRPAGSFAELDEETQIAVLEDIEDGDFFFWIRLLTMGGMFANPSWGGNRDQVGWKLIGFEGHFGFQPPFGWYDAHPELES